MSLVLLLGLWVLGLFYLPAEVWIEPFAGDSAVLVAGPLEIPAAGDRPGRRSLPRIELRRGETAVLAIDAGPGSALALQVRGGGQGVVGQYRFGPREETTRYRVVLDSRRLPPRLQLTLWNRSRSPVSVDTVTQRPLSGGHRWARRLYRSLGLLVLLAVGWRQRHRIADYLRDPEARRERSAHRRGDRLAALLLMLFCFTVFRSAPVHQLLDSKFITVVSHSVLHSASVALPESFRRSERAHRIYTLRPVGERTYHYFAAAPAVLNAPLVALFEWVGVRSIDSQGRYLGHNEQRILRFVAALLAAALCAVLFLLARWWLPPVWALGLTLAFAFGSPILSVLSRPFWSHAWSTLLLAMALWLLAAPNRRQRWGSYVGIATLLCWAYFCRPPLSLAILGVSLYVLLCRRRFFLPYLATGLAWAILFATFAWRIYGSLVPPYFLSSHLESGRLAGGLLLTSYPEAVFGTLLSPGRGLFVYVPLVAVTLWVVWRRWRWLPDRDLAVLALGVCLAHWQLVSLFRNWWGGQSFGPRLMSDLVPWLFLLAVLAVAGLRAAAAAGELVVRRWQKSAVALLVAVSVFIHVRGAWVQQTQRGAGIWNWRYPQFMAGLLARPDEIAPADGEESRP